MGTLNKNPIQDPIAALVKLRPTLSLAQGSILRKLKCSDMQGYLFSPPDTLEAASTLRVAQVAHLHAVDCNR